MTYKIVKADSETVRRQNRQLVLETIRRRGAASRTRISEDSKLSSASVSAITGALLEEGVLIETPAPRQDGGPRGRPQIRLHPNPDFAHVVCAQITVAEIGVLIADYAGNIVAHHARPIAGTKLDGSELVDALALAIETVLKERGLPISRVQRIEIAVQGIVDAAGQELLWTPFLTSRGIAFAAPLQRRLNVPGIIVNDCAAMVEGLNWTEAERFGGNYAVVLAGYGVGMGLFLNGRTFTGRRSSAAEFGHVNHQPGGPACRCGKRGCIEAHAADYAIWRAATGAGREIDPNSINPTDDDMNAVAGRARAGDERAAAAYRDAGEAIGYGLGRLFALVDPLKIVFTGNGMRAFDLLEPHILNGLRDSLVDAMADQLDYSVIVDETDLVYRGAIMGALVEIDRSNSALSNGQTIQS